MTTANLICKLCVTVFLFSIYCAGKCSGPLEEAGWGAVFMAALCVTAGATCKYEMPKRGKP